MASKPYEIHFAQLPKLSIQQSLKCLAQGYTTGGPGLSLEV